MSIKIFNTHRHKTTETSTAMVSKEIFFSSKNFTDSNHTEVTVYVVSVEIVICSSCNIMTTLDCCKKKNDVVFSVEIDVSKLTLSA